MYVSRQRIFDLKDGLFLSSRMGLLLWIFMLFWSATIVSSKTIARVNEKGFTEHCDTEIFTARCKHGEVIVMQTAKYGRMKFSKCVDKDWGYLGCYTDVMLLADRWCSGRRSCQIPIPNGAFKAVISCPSDLLNYFEASFSCVKVETADAQECRTSKYILPSSPTSGVLANYLTLDTNKGSDDCPWVVQARLGQRINITLIDFSRPNIDHNSGPGSINDVCHVYAVITESMTRNQLNPFTVCGGGQVRERSVYVSKGHTLEVRILGSQLNLDERRYFLLKYEVYGCETPKPFPNTWMKLKDENHILIGCNGRDNVMWNVECIHNNWLWDESVGNCTVGKTDTDAVDVGILEFLLNIFALPLEYTLVVVIVIALAIIFLAVVLGICCVKVICPKKKKPQQQHTTNGRHRHHSDGNRARDKAKPVQAVQPTTKPCPHKKEVSKTHQQTGRQMETMPGNLGNLPPPPAFLMDIPEKEKVSDSEDEMPTPPPSPTDPWPIKPPPTIELPPTPGRSPPSYSQLFQEEAPKKEGSGQFETLDKGRHIKGHRRIPSDVTLTLQPSPRGHHKIRNQIPLSAGYQTNPHNSFEFPPPPKEFLRQTSEPGQEKHRVQFQDMPTTHKRRDKRLSSDPLRNHILRDTPGTMRKYQKNPASQKTKQMAQQGKPQSYGSFSQQILNARPPTEATLMLDNSTVPHHIPRHEQTYFELEPESTVPYEMGYSVKTGKKFKVYHSESHEKEKQMLQALECSPSAKKKKGNTSNTM